MPPLIETTRRDLRGKVAWGLVVVVCLAAPWATRLLLIRDKGLAPPPVDLRGAFADASVGLLTLGVVAALLTTGRRWARFLALAALLSLVFASFAMYEFISLFDSLYALSHAGFLGDSTFVGGSVRHMRYPGLFVAIATLAAVGALWGRVEPRKAWWGAWGGFLASCVLAQIVLPVSHGHDEWRQRHALYANLLVTPFAAGARTKGAIGADVRDVFHSNLRGERWLGPLPGKPNVLLIMVEAASGAYLPSVAAAQGVQSSTTMPKLDELAKGHILFTRVISHQRQTNRGEYAILCGDYPKLVTDQSKMSEQVYGSSHPCLPALFREAGYSTAYIQSAPLGFMLKDQFMHKAGFEVLVGDPSFAQSYARTDWGVDDKAFFEQALRHVLGLHEAERPFFATLLTVGTHHPYTFPNSFAPEGVHGLQARAFRWADDAVAGFLKRLEQHGVLADTVVIVTSDESTGLARAANSTQRLLSQSWSFLMVMLPQPQAKRIDDLYGHVDFALSVADLLGEGRRARRFIGRSLFRRYEAPRRLFAGNTYARRVIMWEPSGSAVVCDESIESCTRSIPTDGLVFGPERTNEPVSPRARQLVTEVARLTRSGQDDMTEARGIALLREDQIRVPAKDGKKLIVGGQYLRVPASSVVRVDLDLEVAGNEAATVDLHQNVLLNGYVVYERKGVQLHGKDRWRLSYEFGVPEDSTDLVVQLYARIIAGDSVTIRFHDARLSMTKAPVESKEPVVIRDAVERPAAP